MLVLILMGYSLLLAIRVKMQKLSIELEKGTNGENNSSDTIRGRNPDSNVKKRSLDKNENIPVALLKVPQSDIA